MRTANQKLLDSLIRHQIHLVQYSEGVSASALRLLRETETDLERIILSYATRLNNRPLETKLNRRRLRNMESEVRELRGGAWKQINQRLRSELSDLTSVEAGFYSSVLIDSIPAKVDIKKPDTAKIKQQVLSAPVQGKILRDWLASLMVADVTRIVDQMKTSLVDLTLTTPEDVTRQVIGTNSQNRRDGAARKSWPGATGLFATMVTRTTSAAQTAVVNENTFFVNREYYTAVIDSRTTPICMNYDGRIFEVNKGPYPPLHFRCRSLRVPYIIPGSVANRPFNNAVESTIVAEYAADNNLGRITNRDNLPFGTKTNYEQFARRRRRAFIGQIPDRTSYAEWLKTQSVAFQNEVLGVRRGQLFRKSGLPLSKFINRRGNFLTLEQLAEKGIE